MGEQGTKGKDQRLGQKIETLVRGAKKEGKFSCTRPSLTRSMSKKERGGTIRTFI
jgi:hypothetical protein